jgi:hypothetical protein
MRQSIVHSVIVALLAIRWLRTSWRARHVGSIYDQTGSVLVGASVTVRGVVVGAQLVIEK